MTPKEKLLAALDAGDKVTVLDIFDEIERERESVTTKLTHCLYAMDTVAKFVQPRIPADQNPEQATSFLAWIGMILRLEERLERAERAALDRAGS